MGGRFGPCSPPRHDRTVLRRSQGAQVGADRRRGQGLSLYPVGHERRAHPDRRGMHRRRAVLHRQGQRLCQGAQTSSAAPSAKTRACSSPSHAPMSSCPPRPRWSPRPRACSMRARPRGPRPICQKCWRARPAGPRQTCASRRTAVSASPREYDVERKFRETRLYQVAPISTNLILSHVATHVLDLPKSF